MIPASLALLLGILGLSPADQKGTLAKRLATPLSPGAVALLATDAREPAVVARLEEALRDPRPQTRAAAARVVMTAPVPELRKAVEDALGAETDAEAAREEIRAVATLAPSDDGILFGASDRFEARLDPDLAKILARARGPAAIPSLLFGRTWNLTAREWASALWIAARGNMDALNPAVARTLGAGDARRWDALLDLFELKDRVASRQVVAAGLHSGVPEIAARSALYLAWARLREPLPSDAETLGPLDPPAGATPDTVFLFTLLARAVGRSPEEDLAWTVWLADAKASFTDRLEPGSPYFSLMTGNERDAVRVRYNARNGIAPKEAEQARSRWEKTWTFQPHKTDRRFVFRTFSGLPRAVASDAIAVGKCRPPRKEIFGVAAVWYSPDGRPRQIRSYESPASEACETVALALASISLARDDEFPIGEAPDFLFGAARTDCLGVLEELDVCPSVCPDDRDETLSVGGRVTAPRIADRVEPRYPEASRLAGKQGVVTIEAIIAADGCVAEVSVLEGVDPILDVEAARAVAQWKYHPARIGERAVRVYLTVSVTFKLT